MFEEWRVVTLSSQPQRKEKIHVSVGYMTPMPVERLTVTQSRTLRNDGMLELPVQLVVRGVSACLIDGEAHGWLAMSHRFPVARP